MKRTIEYTKKFRKDYKRELKIDKKKALPKLLLKVVGLLADDKILPRKYYDHALSGDYNGYRECHLKPDLLLVYGKPSRDVLQLVRIGSHSELGF